MKTKLFLLLAFLCQLTFAQVSDQGLIAYYPFNNNTQNEVPNGGAYNLLSYGSGADYNLVHNGGVTGGAINNSNAYQFNNGKSLMATNFFGLLESNSNQNFSVSYWVSYNNPIPSFGALNTQIEAFSSLFVRGTISFGVNTSSTGSGGFNLGGSSSTHNTFAQVWNHITIVFNATEQTLTVYRNGSVFGSSISTSGNTIYKYNNRFVIGGGSNADGTANSSKSFSGKIDEVYVFNRALQPSEVTALYDKQVPTTICPPGNVTFTTQAEVSNFLAQYPNCTQINGNLTIEGWDVTNLSSLGNLTSITGDMNMYLVNSSASLTGFQNITTVGGRVYIEFQRPNVDYLSGLTSVGGLVIAGAGITNLNGLSNITGHIPGNLEVFGNPITNLTGLNNITSVGNDLLIAFSNNLVDLTGLNNITSIGKSLIIHFNNNLTSLNGLNNLTTIGDINLINSGFSFRGNPLLTNINTLENVSNIVRGFNLWDNASLTNCAIAPVCNKLANSTTNITLTGNATGCESIAVVQAACAALSSSDFELESNLKIYPNPFNSQITFDLGSSYENITVLIYDITGKQLYQNSFSGNQLVINNLGNLPSGIYVATLTTENGTSTTKKLIK